MVNLLLLVMPTDKDILLLAMRLPFPLVTEAFVQTKGVLAKIHRTSPISEGSQLPAQEFIGQFVQGSNGNH